MQFQRINQQHQAEIVMLGQRAPARGRNADGLLRIGQHQHACPRAQHATGMIQCTRQAQIVDRRLCIPAGQRVEHAQHAAWPARRGNRRFAVTAAQRTHAVAAALRRPRGNRTGTGGLYRFEAHARAEVQRRRRIGHDQADPLALGLEQFGMGAACARSHAPIDVARVIASYIFARLGVFHAAAAQLGRCLARVAGAATARRRRTLCQPP